MGLLQRISALILFASLACIGCSNATDEAGNAPPPSTVAALELPGASQVDFDVIAGQAKIRNGSDLDFWGLTGNSTVLIIGPGGGVCTAQVINKFFLLTAAHCIVEVTPNGADAIQIMFTDTSSNRFQLAVVVGVGYQIPNWQAGDNDIGLYYLVDGINTCQDTFGNCRNSQVNTPVNAGFQVYYPGLEYTASRYAFVGYGTPDDAMPDLRLRIGSATISRSMFTQDGTAHQINTTWSDNDARPCRGDSGSPLVYTQFARLIHNGVLSRNNCTSTSGSAAYAGLSNDQAIWILNTMRDTSPTPIAYRCATASMAMPGGQSLGAFACDNDGSLY